MNEEMKKYSNGVHPRCPNCKIIIEYISDGWKGKKYTKNRRDKTKKLSIKKTRLWNIFLFCF